MSLPEGVAGLVGPYLAGQRWYAGSGVPAPGSIEVVESTQLARGTSGAGLHWAIVDVDGTRYQLLIGERPDGPSPGGLLEGREPPLLGRLGEAWFYDATADAELMLALHERVVGRPADHVRPVGAEQSNTSLVYDEQTILKVFRRLLDGPNPDVEVTSALAAAGFTHVAEPVGAWREGGVDLAFAQRFLTGGAEGWTLALDSVRRGCDEDAGQAVSDFVSEAFALGRVTAEMHLALAGAFRSEPFEDTAWEVFVGELAAGLARLAAAGEVRPGWERAVERLRSVRRPGPALRVHGDFHLGQVMRAGGIWYVLDFEGEPARSMDERLRRTPPAKDVAGMLRSFDYASHVALQGRDTSSAERDRLRATDWQRRCRAAYLEGYRGAEGVAALIGDPAEADVVVAAFELDKALYELRYEQAYRPAWTEIPAAALGRIIEHLRAGSGTEAPGSG